MVVKSVGKVVFLHFLENKRNHLGNMTPAFTVGKRLHQRYTRFFDDIIFIYLQIRSQGRDADSLNRDHIWALYNRRLLVTTDILENAMASAARIG